MAITTNAIANSFKKELLEGKHNFTASTGDKFKLALYTSSATLGKSTTAFTSTNQVTASGSYVSGGGALVNAGTSLPIISLKYLKESIYPLKKGYRKKIIIKFSHSLENLIIFENLSN
jgi:hypothetical protein